ncbi:hypothetical protein [Streptomyces clavuligerus]|uniref:Uncharacterized protein n=1 Tax=Streptomyces clavuligerus TaxID=1901 RepID=D5SI96_STRCL|nr:hypothetical protein [Streptomyces clavuligerus]EFG03639.1 Hypothetical protein SCLAV_p0148 [Streptomyces clavuligerus]MBY6307799.1 hypothetical protein [Streptomyces clavuligerus]QCS09651.1 hypothetical protein CRV15_28835 [Streptomyces clavuligerus]QPJ98305.1 hypothetical protein GE265_35515 [Streptomyces clavuligerus]WDN57581.1 hypothetical protein LL058_31455 [Streptomyces clavuligerus]
MTSPVPDLPLLDYAVVTTPQPLTVSTSGDAPNTADIDIIVSNGREETVYCKQFVFTIKVGTLAQDITEDPDAIAITVSPADQWAFVQVQDEVLYAVPTDDYAAFTASGPATADYRATPVSDTGYTSLVADSVTFHLTGIPVNTQVGTTRISIQETATTDDPDTSASWPTTPRTMNHPLTKAPAVTAKSLVVDSLTVQGDANFQSDLILADQKQIRAVESGTFSVQSAVLESPQISGPLAGAGQESITVASNLQFNDQCVIGPVGDGVLWIKQPHIQGTLLGEDSTLDIGDAITADKGITATGVSSFEKLQVTSELYGVNGILNVTATTLDAYNVTVDETLTVNGELR